MKLLQRNLKTHATSNSTICVICIFVAILGAAVFVASRTPNNISKQDNSPLPAEKILTVSADEWCQSAGRRLDEFQLVGVQSMKNVLGILKKAPPGTVVIVNYHYDGFEYATALVPKALPEKPEK